MLMSNVAVCYIYMWYQVYIFSRQLDLDGRTSLEGILQNINNKPWFRVVDINSDIKSNIAKQILFFSIESQIDWLQFQILFHLKRWNI